MYNPTPFRVGFFFGLSILPFYKKLVRPFSFYKKIPLSDHSHYTKIPIIRIASDQILLYEVFDGRSPRSDKQKQNEENLTRGEYNGYMSPKTRSKVKKYLGTWVESVESVRQIGKSTELEKIPQLTFVTLTLPSKQEHSDNEIKRKCLTPFIEHLKYKYDVWHYFWRAESQKNGNIHFHLIIDSYIHWLELRKDWNRCVNKLGYLDRFEKRYNHRSPNSTDIQDLKSKKNPAAYVIKYCCKSDGYRKINGRIHGCSDELRNLEPYQNLLYREMEEFAVKVMKEKDSFVVKDETFVVIKCDVQKMIAKHYPDLREEIKNHRHKQNFYLYHAKIPDIAPEILEEDYVSYQETFKIKQLTLDL